MGTDPGIICFQHCYAKVFCISLPKTCCYCCNELSETQFKLMPFRIPFPFVQASQHNCSVVIRPSGAGDFLNEYNCSDTDLHIGVTNSCGDIVEFDRFGLRRNTERNGKSTWSQCLLVESIPDAWNEHWDDILIKTCKRSQWLSTAYHEDSNNCYSFVLSFLQSLDFGILSKTAHNRTLFCEKYIVPRTTSAGKYISLYRKIRDQGFYVADINQELKLPQIKKNFISF